MVLTSQPKSPLSRKIKIRQIADSDRSSASRAWSRLAMQQRQQQQQPKVRKIAEESGWGNGGGGGGGASASSGGERVLQSSSASAATRRAASPVLSQSGRRQLLPRSSSHSPEPVGKSASLPERRSSEPPARGILRPGRAASPSSALEARGLRALLQLRGRKPGPESRPAKCVSFSADTIERHGRPGAELGGQPRHDTKLYRRGVLQDRRRPADNLPLSWEESLGGPRALLGAAHDADDELVQRIVSLAGKLGLGDIQPNAQDSSGRTAISYLAGNGSALVLEACLALPGADANLPDNEGNAPLHFAAQAGQTECLNVLLQRCANIEVDARNGLGFTPLMKAGVQGRTKCAKILLFAGANPTLRDHGRGLRAEQWARFCGRYVCAEVIERFARHRLLDKAGSCRWGSEPELAAQLLQAKLGPVPSLPAQPPPASGLKSKIRRVFRTASNSDKTSFSLVSQLTSAALCASSPVLPKPGDVSPVVKGLLRPLSVPQLRITLVAPQDVVEKTSDKCTSHSTTFTEKIESAMVKPPRTKKKSK